jgi:hypothetical protein
MKKIGLLSLIVITLLLSACSGESVQCGEGTVAVGAVCEVVPTCLDTEVYNESSNTCETEVVDPLVCSEGYIEENGSCVLEEDEDDEVCEEGYTDVNGSCVLDTVDGVISLVSGAIVDFEVGDSLPDFSSYFEAEGITIDNAMIEHNLLLDANNIMTTPGVYTVTVTAGSDSLTITVTVSDPTLDYSDIITVGQPGVYINTAKQTEFSVGDYMPNFLTYFVAYDGEKYVSITPDLVLHNLLLSADNRLIQAGSYKAWVEITMGGTLYRGEVDITVLPVGGSTVDTIGATGWDIINPEFTDANLYDAWMIPSGDVSITNTNGEVEIMINTIGMNFWDILFAQPGKTFEKGYTYEVTYRMKTGLVDGRDVVVFVEPSAGAPKLLEEQISLTTSYQDFTFSFQTTTNTETGMIGVFLGANLPGAHPGTVIIDSITIVRTGEKQEEVLLTDFPNQLFTESDISAWVTEGNVTLNHNASGYLEADVTSFTGLFYQDNIQLGGFYVSAGTTYQVSFTIRTSILNGRDVTFFVEDTNAGYAKYFEVTESLTDSFQTFTYTFTPTQDNDDTKIGIFLGDMENAALGMVIIDSIVITVVE